jgi:uncharacterized protein YukE
MQQSARRLQEIMDSSLQILAHMEVDPQKADRLQTIKTMLNEESRKLSGLLNGPGNESSRQDMAAMRQRLEEISTLLNDLSGDLLEDYNQSAGHNRQEYERMDIGLQQENAEAYHDKIDYRSAVKLQENVNKMNSELREWSGSIEHDLLQRRENAGAGTAMASAPEYDNDPAPSHLSP